MRSSRAVILVSLAFVFLLTSCSTGAEPQVVTESTSASFSKPDLSQDTSGEFIAIQSDNVAMAGYDASTQTMTVMFDNGKSYWYQPVDQSVWTAFYNAQPHPWSQVGYPELVSAGIPYGRLN